MLLIGISIKIVLALVASFPTNLVSSNSSPFAKVVSVLVSFKGAAADVFF